MTQSLPHKKQNCKYHKDQKQELYLENKEDELRQQLIFMSTDPFTGIN